jgi:lipoate-protein ligase A
VKNVIANQHPNSLSGEARMFRRRKELRENLLELIEKFRKKGVLSPEKAMTAEELGLPAEFKDRMKRRLGQLGVFVEVDGKYYLSEDRLKEVKDKISERRRARNW